MRKITSTFSAIVGLALISASAQATDFFVTPFEADSQGTAPWCWASVAKMVLDHEGVQVGDTCEIVSAEKGLKCCGFFPSSGCWQGGNPGNALKKFGVNYRYTEVAANQGSAPVSAASTIVAAIRHNKMPILEMYNAVSGQPNHVVVVKGVRNMDNINSLVFDIYDPNAGEQLVPARYLLNGFYSPLGGDRFWFAGIYLP